MQTTVIYSFALLAAASFAIVTIATPIFRGIFLRFGIVDRPDAGRKLHPKPVPRIGGIPVLVAYLGAFGILALVQREAVEAYVGRLPFRWELLVAALAVFATGLLDDIRGLRPWQKLLGLLIGALLAWHGGVQIVGIHAHPIPSWLSLPATVLWLVGCGNAFNLIDGIDGLAVGVGVFATLTMVISALMFQNEELALVTIPLAATLAGFLCYNFNPASIFLGDAGSLLIGFLLGCYGVLWCHKSTAALGMLAPVIALSLPLFDTALAIVRRVLRRQPILAGDRRHIHHRLLDRGLTQRRAVLLLYGACAIAASLSLLESVYEELSALITVLTCGAIFTAIQRLEYVELSAVRRAVAKTGLRTAVLADIHLSEFRSALAAARTAEQCWDVVRTYYTLFGFDSITLQLAGRQYSHERDTATGISPICWTVLVPLSSSPDYARLSCDSGAGGLASAMGFFADALRDGLTSKSASLATAAGAGGGAGSRATPPLVRSAAG